MQENLLVTDTQLELVTNIDIEATTAIENEATTELLRNDKKDAKRAKRNGCCTNWKYMLYHREVPT